MSEKQDVLTARSLLKKLVLGGVIQPGEVVVIRYEGPKGGPGMREMFKAMKFMYGAGLSKSCALITDGRFREQITDVS